MKTDVKAAILVGLGILLTSNPLFASDFVVVQYRKEDLQPVQEGQFIKSRDLSHVLASKLQILAVTLTQRQGGSNAALHSALSEGNQLSSRNFQRKMATLADPNQIQSKGDGDKVRTILSGQTRKAGEVNLKNAFPIVERLQRGLFLKLDLKNTFSEKSNEVAYVPEIRYGLVATEIVPTSEAMPIAARGGIDEWNYGYAGSARVVYTIDKLEQTGSNAAFSPLPQDSFSSSYSPVQSTSMWQKAPSTKVDVKIDAADGNSAVSDQVNQSDKPAMPGMRVSVTQVEGLLSTQFVTGTNTRESLTSEVKLPVFKEISIGRKYDYNFNATETSVQNLLGNSKLPRINVFYANKEGKFKGEYLVKRDGLEYTLTAEPRAGWHEDDNRNLGRVGDKFSLGLNTWF